MKLRLVATEARVVGTSISHAGVTAYGQTLPGSRYRIVDEDGRELENYSELSINTPGIGYDNELWGEVTIRLPLEVA